MSVSNERRQYSNQVGDITAKRFVEACEAIGYSCEKSDRNTDIYDHIDYFVTRLNDETSVDVKGGNHPNTIWVEVKKVNGEKAAAYYERVDPETGEIFHLEPEFMLCSTRPGIGRRWYERFGAVVRAADAVVARGFESKPPRYYDKLMEASHPKAFAVAKAARIEAGASDDAWKDQRPARLAVREAVKKAQYQSLKRNLE